MTDLRDRIADVLCDRLADLGVSGGRFMADTLAKTLLEMPGIGIVQLPDFNAEYGCYTGGGYPCNGDPEQVTGCPGGMVRTSMPMEYLAPVTARDYAAALLGRSQRSRGESVSGIRSRLADALTREMTTDGVPHTGAHLADTLLSLPGIAIIEVPEGMYVSLRYDRDAEIARANAAESQPKQPNTGSAASLGWGDWNRPDAAAVQAQEEQP